MQALDPRKLLPGDAAPRSSSAYRGLGCGLFDDFKPLKSFSILVLIKGGGC